MIIAFTSMVLSWLGGELLDIEITYYRVLFAVMIAAALICAWALTRFPVSHSPPTRWATPGRISA